MMMMMMLMLHTIVFVFRRISVFRQELKRKSTGTFCFLNKFKLFALLIVLYLRYVKRKKLY